jgi:hypothetical protein
MIPDMVSSDEDLSERSRQAERRATERPQRFATRR